MTKITVRDHPLWAVINDGQPYEPLDWQLRHFHAQTKARRIIAACGRRSGKSWGMRAEVVAEAFRPPETVLGVVHHPLIYICGPTTETSMRCFQPVWDLFVPSKSGSYEPPLGRFYKDHDKTRRIIWLTNGAVIQGKTGDDPRSLQGDRVTFAVVDEAHDFPEEAWRNLMPALSDSRGRLIAIGVARGKSRFRSYWDRGQEGDTSDGGWYSFSVPTKANPIYEQHAEEAGYDDVDAYIRAAFAEDLSEMNFLEEYMAEWQDVGSNVFGDLDPVFTGGWEEPDDSQVNIMGLDIGKIRDYTVAYVGDVRRERPIAKDRFHGLDYTVAVPRIAALYQRYNCRFVHLDQTGIGEPVADMLRAEGCMVVPFLFTNERKNALVSTLARECERGNVKFPADDENLRREMDRFEGTYTVGGTIRFSAPDGYFDDAVMAAGLLVMKMASNRRMSDTPLRPNYVSFEPRASRHRVIERIRRARERAIAESLEKAGAL